MAILKIWMDISEKWRSIHSLGLDLKINKVWMIEYTEKPHENRSLPPPKNLSLLTDIFLRLFETL